LLVHKPLVIIPDLPTSAWEHRSHAQELLHGCRLEDPSLRIDQWYAFAAKLKPGAQVVRRKYPCCPDALEVLNGSQTDLQVNIVVQST
jgi:hypothetical protein